MRCLCSIHVFSEPAPDAFANNRISAALVNNEPLRAYILLLYVSCVSLTLPLKLTSSSGFDLYSASDHLPRYLSDPVVGPSYSVQETPFQTAVNTKKPRWEWLEEKVPAKAIREDNSNGYPGPFGDELKQSLEGKADNELISRPEHKVFGLAMLGGGRVFGQAHLYDYPWAELGKATVVDVGGGVGTS